MPTSVEQVEYFHLAFLRVLESRLNRAHWVVKGGVNLRAWFGSIRYSEDLDVDIVRGSVHRVAERIDGVLEAVSFRDLLAAQGLKLARHTKPKQTETTQRWKFEVRAEGGLLPLHTRIEFSRRGSSEEYILESVRPEIVRPYGLLAPTANHYTARSAIWQKIQALAGRAQTQARDIWDLDHLFRTTSADPRPLPPDLRNALIDAVERVQALPYDVFKAQVVPFLAPEHQELYGREAWARIRELVVDRLTEMVE